MSEYGKTAISLLGLKDALLYFKYVISLTDLAEFVFEDRRRRKANNIPRVLADDLEDVDCIASLVETELLPPELRTKRFLELRRTSSLLNTAYIEPSLENSIRKQYAGTDNIESVFRTLFDEFPTLTEVPLITSPEWITDESNGENEVLLKISSVQLIDTQTCKWKQLVEFRKDTEAMSKLRRFRLFAYENYKEKSQEFIEDDMLIRLEDYERAVRKWGFVTTTGAINVFLNSTLIAGGLAGSFLTAYYNAPLVEIATAMGATGVAIANMAVNLGQQQFARKELMANNPVSYISYAREKLEGK